MIVLDVSPSMRNHLGGDNEEGQSRFEVALDSIKMLIEQKVRIPQIETGVVASLCIKL